MTDGELLSRFVQSGCEDSFRQLVERYLVLVRGVALRKTGRPEMAEEIAMQVFAAAARKAAALSKRPSLGGWLLVAARHSANEAIRKDETRRRHMKLLRDEAGDGLETNDGDRAWEEVSPLLDDALASLPEMDREAVVLHFYQKLPYREIGNRLGRGEDAARKRVNRALERMGVFFRRRGVVVTAAVLCAGLGSRLSEAKAGAAGASALAAKTLALTGTKAGSAVGISTTLQLMAHGKPLLTAGACVAALVLSTGAGYVIGNQRGNAHREQIVAASSGVAAIPSNPRPSSDSSRLPIAPIESPGISLRGLISKMADAVRETGERPSAWVELQRQRDSVKADQYREAIGIAEEAYAGDGRIPELLTAYLIADWAKHDGESAADFVMNRRSDFEGLLGSVFVEWAASGPEDARAWLDKNGSGFGVGVSMRLQGQIFNGWVRADPGSAMDAFEKLSYDEQRGIVNRLWSATRSENEDIRNAFFERVSQVEDERLRAEIFDKSIVDALKGEPELAGRAYDAMKFTEPGLRWRAINRAADGMYSGDPEGTVKWVWRRAPAERRDDVIRDWVAGGWANEDRERAEAWLHAAGYDPEEWLRKERATTEDGEE